MPYDLQTHKTLLKVYAINVNQDIKEKKKSVSEVIWIQSGNTKIVISGQSDC